MEIRKSDIAKYITVIKLSYPSKYKDMTKEDVQMLVEFWHRALKEYPLEIVDAAVDMAVKSNKYDVNLACVIEGIEKILHANDKSEIELWDELVGVFNEVLYCRNLFHIGQIEANGKTVDENSRARIFEIYENLPAEVKAYLQNAQTLLEFAEMPDDTLSYEKGRFFKMIPRLRETAAIKATMPDNVKQLVQGLAAQKCLEGGNES